MMAGRSITPPKKPEKVHAGFRKRLAAFFGSKKAKKFCAAVDRKNATAQDIYQDDLNAWNRTQKMDPDFVKQVQNRIYSMMNYFQAPKYDDIMRERRFVKMYEIAHKQPLVDGIKEMTTENSNNTAKALGDMMKKNPEVTSEARDLAAQICYQRMLADHAQKELNNGKLKEDDISRITHEAVHGSPEYRKCFERISGSETFKYALNQLNENDLKAFAENPHAAADAIYTKCKKAVAFKQSEAAMKDVRVKEKAKDFTASSKRPKLDQVEAPKQSKEAPVRL